MRLEQLSPSQIAGRLAGPGLALALPPFAVRISSPFPAIARELPRLYGAFALLPDDGFVDFHAAVEPGRGLRRWWRPQAWFSLDGARPFLPVSASQAFPVLEWGLNWCVAAHVTDYLIIHAAVLARNDQALLLPGMPGSGKSTLAAALACRGWRLISDEHALIRRSDGQVLGQARPVSLKNASIKVIRSLAPQAVFSEPVHDTVKGVVSHMAPKPECVARAGQAVPVRWVVTPRYAAGAGTRLAPLGRGAAFMALVGDALNYSVLGREGFELLGDVVPGCQSAALEFDDLDAAAKEIETFCRTSP